jgi:hypothetical protein
MGKEEKTNQKKGESMKEIPIERTMYNVYLIRAFLFLLCGMLFFAVSCKCEKDDPELELKMELLPGQPGKPDTQDTYVPPGDLSDDSPLDSAKNKPPIKFSVSEPPQASVKMMAGDVVNMICFYDEGEEVGRLTWEDVDGDGELELRWIGIAVDRSAKVMIDFMKQSGRLCACPE